MQRFFHVLLLLVLALVTVLPAGGPQPVGAAASYRISLPIAYRNAAEPRTTAMAFGAGVIDNNFELVQAMNFPWMKLNINMSSASDPVNLIDSARQRYPGVKLLIRLDNTPTAWRTGNPSDPVRSDLLAAYLRSLAARLKGKVQAYELYNEPNLKWEWNTNIAGGGDNPSSLGYVRILQTAYPAIKGADPNVTVITGGVSDSSSGGGGNIGDVEFVHQLYSQGGYGYFDAVGTHPYGGACAFDAGGCSEDIYFRRAEVQHARMVNDGDTVHQMWATELGWVVDPRAYGWGGCMAGLGGRANWVRSPDDVAYQLASAYRFAADNWPWMGGMFFFNFDYSAAGWVTGYDKVCDAPAWYSIVSKNNMPGRPYSEPAFAALAALGRQYGKSTR
jgi:hypothetical protein